MFDDFGGPEVLYLGDALDPVAGPGEIVVDIHAASVNAADWKVRAAPRAGEPGLDLPHVLGRDFSGVPVLQINYRAGRAASRSELKEVRREDFDAELFEVPAGFQKQRMFGGSGNPVRR